MKSAGLLLLAALALQGSPQDEYKTKLLSLNKSTAAKHYSIGEYLGGASMFQWAREQYYKAIEFDPDHEGARSGIREIQRLRSHSGPLSALWVWPVVLAALVAGLLVTAVRRTAPAESPDPGVRASVDALAAGQERLAEEIRHLRRENESLRKELEGTRPAPPPPPAEESFEPLLKDLAGMASREDSEALWVRFHTPLFDPGSSVLKPEAEKRVLDLARRLAPLAGKISVQVLSIAEGPGDRAAVAQRRGERMVECLKTPPGLQALAATSQVLEGTSTLPFPKEPPEAQAVVLRLMRARK